MSRTLSPEHLLAHEPFLRSLARRLVSQEADVQDVVQETWTRALGSPPGALKNPRGWLSRVVRNVVHDRQRSDASRSARERDTRGEELLESVDESAARLESHQTLVAAVLSLEEPYRSVVLLTHFQSLAPREVAERLGRSPGTVRVQLHRAHGQLREVLDAQFGGERATWCALLLPVAGLGRKAGGSATAVPVLGLALALGGAAAAFLAIGVWITSADPGTLAGGPPESSMREVVVEVGPQVPIVEERSAPFERQAVGDGVRVEVRGPMTTLDSIPVHALAVTPLDEEVVLRAFPEGGALPLQLAERFGRKRETDEDGYVFFDELSPGTLLFAGTPGHFGMLEVSADPSAGITLDLEPCLDVRVGVLAADGTSVARAPVTLRVHWETEGAYGGPKAMDLGTSRTGDGGEPAHFLGVDRVFGIETMGDVSYSATLRMPGTAVETPVRGAANRSEEVSLALPPVGRVALRILDPRGELLRERGQVQVTETDRTSPMEYTLFFEEGRVSLDWIAPGTRLKLRVSLPERGVEWNARVTGPGKAGETIQHDLSVPELPRIMGRAHDANGPLVGQSITLYLCPDEASPGELVRTTTDEEGRFHVALEGHLQHEELEIAVVVQDGPVPRLAGLWTAIDLRGEDRGEIRLEPVPGRITGRVLGPDGAPRSGVDVVVPQLVGERLVARTGPGGEFVAHGLNDPSLSFTVRHGDHVLGKIERDEVDPNRFTLHLTPGGSITGNVQAPRGEEDQVRVRLFSEEGDRLTRHKGAGSFEFGGLANGRYRVEIQFHGQPVLDVGGLSVQQGARTLDPRLQDVDLRASMQGLLVHVTDEQGEPVPATVRVFHGSELLARELADPSDGLARLTHARCPAPTVVVEHGGYRPVKVDHAGPEVQVELRTGLAIELYTQQQPELRRGNRRIQLSLRLQEPEPIEGTSSVVNLPPELGAEGRCQVVFPGPGLYRLFEETHSGAGSIVVTTSPSPVRGDWTLLIQERDAGTALTLQMPETLFE